MRTLFHTPIDIVPRVIIHKNSLVFADALSNPFNNDLCFDVRETHEMSFEDVRDLVREYRERMHLKKRGVEIDESLIEVDLSIQLVRVQRGKKHVC